MIVTREWLKDFIDISNITTDNICKAFNSIGLEVDSVKKIEIPQGIKIGFVESCEKHPDADKLSIAQVNLGFETVQIVCGASNVKAGLFVPVATIGTKLSETFEIKPSVLRGTASNGMICSSTEMGLPKLNDGILPLDNSIGELILGASLRDYPLLNDEVIEIELTPNRGDCLNIAGVAKELSAYFSLPLIELENTKNEHSGAIGRILEVDYLTSTTPSLIFKVVDIEEFLLPLVYKYRVAILEISKNSDIETAVAYCVHSTGVALNLYSQTIAQIDEKMHLSIKDNENGFAQVVSDVPLSTIGLSCLIPQTIEKTIIIEASYIEPTSIAKKVFATKQKTGDLYYKSSRGTNPNLQFGLNYFMTFLSSFGGKIFKGQLDFITEIQPKLIDVNINTINQIIGQEVNKKLIENILTSLGFTENKLKTTDTITFQVPSQRHDIVNIADVAEEIVRMIGIDNIEAKPLFINESSKINNISNDMIKKNKLRSLSIANAFFETTTYVFSSRELLVKYGFSVVSEALDILNPITSDLNTFRTTLLLNLVQGISQNQKNGFKSIGLFEIGTIFDTNRNESKQIGFVWSGNIEDETLSNNGKPKNIDLFTFANKISNCIGEFQLETATNFNHTFFHPYQIANIIQNGQILGILGKLHPTIAKEFDISEATFVAQIDFVKINNELKSATEISKYQSSKRDLSIVVPKDLPFSNISKIIDGLKIDELKEYNLIDIYSDKNLGDNESLTIKFVLQSKVKTLEEDEIVSIMDIILSNLKEKLDIKLR
ncbi:MAG: phenylalanine--tRNA ligase subunit beta [Arcobacter sp.]|nr:phenylalanine--tRNA ligase subunit beta [Arcobacter sp.]